MLTFHNERFSQVVKEPLEQWFFMKKKCKHLTKYNAAHLSSVQRTSIVHHIHCTAVEVHPDVPDIVWCNRLNGV